MDALIKLFTAIFGLFVILALLSMLMAGNLDFMTAANGIIDFVLEFIDAASNL